MSTTPSRRKRPHPARRARQLAGAVSVASLLALTGCMAATTKTSTATRSAAAGTATTTTTVAAVASAASTQSNTSTHAS